MFCKEYCGLLSANTFQGLLAALPEVANTSVYLVYFVTQIRSPRSATVYLSSRNYLEPSRLVQELTVQYIIQFLKVMYLILTLQVPLTLPSVFSKTDSVFLKEDTQKCVFNNTCPRACISQYNPMGVYWLVQALGHVLCNTHS